MSKTSTIVAVVSDTHVGGSTAIAPPKFAIHTQRPKETQVVEHSPIQKWLWACWQDYWQYVKELAGIRGKTRRSRLVVVHLGDVIDGKHHHSIQVMEELPDQTQAACDILKPLADLADGGMFITYGTPAHNGGTGEMEAHVASEIGAQHDYDFCLDIDGLIIDVSHHGRASKRDWSSAAAGMAVEVRDDYRDMGLEPPRYVLRGHNHTADDSGMKVKSTRAIALPSWQLLTAFGYKVVTKRRTDIGGLIIDTARPDDPILSRMRYNAPAGTFKRIVKI